MQALILAAGMGKRLKDLTLDRPKCMVNVSGKPIIHYTIQNLLENSIKKINIVVGHKKDVLIDYLKKEFKNIDFNFIVNPLYSKTNNIYSLYIAKEILIKEDTIILESDIIFDGKVLERLLKNKYKNLAVVDKFKSWMDGSVLILDEENNILSLIDKNRFKFSDAKNYYKTVNIYKFSKNFAKNFFNPILESYIKIYGKQEYYEQIIKIISFLDKAKIKALRLNNEKWYEIDTKEDLKNAEVIFSDNPKEKLAKIKSRYGGYWRYPSLIDFCYLVNPFFPTNKIIEEIKYSLNILIHSYPSGFNVVNSLSADIFDIPEEYILTANGASELIKTLPKVLKGKFGIVYPTFDEYPNVIKKNVVDIYPKNVEYDISIFNGYIDKVDNFLLINPDNPSGNFIKKQELIKFLDILKKYKKILILDESFIDFVENSENESLLDSNILKEYENLVIVKSLSKSFSIAGLRLGILATSNKQIINNVKSHLPIWNINSLAEFFLQIFNKYKSDYINSCKSLIKERERFYNELSKLDSVKVYKSKANYFLIKLKNVNSTKLTENLLFKYDIYIKDLKGKKGIGNKDFIRVAIRTKEENNRLLQCLKEELYE